MKNDSNHIQAVNKPKNGDSNLPALIVQTKENALSILLSYLESLFGSCDDLFFDLSSRAASNTEQNLYFESMRELRVKKNGVIDNFKHTIEQAFAQLPNPQIDDSVTIDDPLKNTAEGLSLVQHDEIEQKVAINGMISKARANNQEAIYQLTTRLDYLSSAKRINNNNNPLDPQQICHGFAEACELLDINIKAKIILYKQFDRLVISKLAKVYSTVNDFLISAGVIPTITHSILKENDTAAASTTGQYQQEQPTENHAGQHNKPAFDFRELSNLLTSLRALGLDRVPNYQSYSANPGPVMSNQDLLATLSLLQLQKLQASDTALGEINLRELINSILAGSTPEKPKAVKQSDEDIINLVAMFFDFVLDDRNLPVAFQALISRLQIPILKVALRDGRFFSNSEHPARQLVNNLASASIGWDDSEGQEKDKTYKAIAGIVQDIIENNDEDDSVYLEKLQQVQALIKQAEHRSNLIEKRTGQAAEGEAKTQKAKLTTQQLLFKQLEGTQLPEVVNEFLVDQWQQLLIITHLKHGEESAQWIDASQLVSDLIWVCRPQQDERSRLRLGRIKADLIKRIQQGLATAAIDLEESTRITQSIEKTIESLQMQTQHCDKREDHVELHTLTAQQAKNLGHTPGGGSKSWKDMTALERQQARYKKLTYEFIKKAESLPLNTWLLYEDTQQGKVLRCKLSAMIEVSDSYIFVNKFGFKVLEKTRKEFAYDMQQNRAKLLQSGLLFDRAMSTIIANLRDLTKSTSSSYQT